MDEGTYLSFVSGSPFVHAMCKNSGWLISVCPRACRRYDQCHACVLHVWFHPNVISGGKAGSNGVDADELAAFMRNIDLDLSPAEAMLVGVDRQKDCLKRKHCTIQRFHLSPAVHMVFVGRNG